MRHAEKDLTYAGVQKLEVWICHSLKYLQARRLRGKIMVVMMNLLGHSPVAMWGLRFFKACAWTPRCWIWLRRCEHQETSKKCPQGIVKSIDYSPVSVEKSKKVNEAAIAEGRCAVLQGSVADMVFADDRFDAVTAFETVYFWPDLPRCFREVYRVLKPGGTFLIYSSKQRRHGQG